VKDLQTGKVKSKLLNFADFLEFSCGQKRREWVYHRG